MSKQTFLQGTLILIFAGMITRFLGFINRLVVARFLGEEGVGLYMMALPTLFLVMTLTQIGLPVAISKRVAEADARNDSVKVKKILTVSLIITALNIIIFTTEMMFGESFIEKIILTDKSRSYMLLDKSKSVQLVDISLVLK